MEATLRSSSADHNRSAVHLNNRPVGSAADHPASPWNVPREESRPRRRRRTVLRMGDAPEILLLQAQFRTKHADVLSFLG
jgi:hypothetical protein